MTERPHPVFRTSENVLLIGTMAIYDSQTEASQLIPHQWREFRQTHPALGSSLKFYGASPCTGDRKIHYLAGVDQESLETSIGGERLNLEAGEYAVLASGRRERNARNLRGLLVSRRRACPSDRSKFGFHSNQTADTSFEPKRLHWTDARGTTSGS